MPWPTGWQNMIVDAAQGHATQRLRVTGGWLYRTIVQPPGATAPAVSLIFVPLSEDASFSDPS